MASLFISPSHTKRYNQQIRSIAFPAISCGTYGYPIAQACDIALREISRALQQETSVEQVIIACFDPRVKQCLIQSGQGLA
ncbi:macro domain-containing protein [Candidatus Venteria ishoeyi]|uniref:macro domain-containing protein n=1 Tax=Candidatus Venteria ishoeyi TaxID=1899563 RepID=UPI000AF0715A